MKIFKHFKNFINKVFYNIINKYDSIVFKIHKIKYGKCCKFYGRIRLFNSYNKVNIGDKCILRSGMKYNPLGGSDCLIFYLGKNGKIKIGNNVGISNSCLHIDTSLIIEDNVMIGGGCKIYDSDMHSVNYKNRIDLQDNDIKSKPILLKRGCFIGAHSIILKGVIVGEKSVVGAGSVVTKNISDNELWAENPAKFVKKIN